MQGFGAIKCRQHTPILSKIYVNIATSKISFSIICQTSVFLTIILWSKTLCFFSYLFPWFFNLPSISWVALRCTVPFEYICTQMQDFLSTVEYFLHFGHPENVQVLCKYSQDLLHLCIGIKGSIRHLNSLYMTYTLIMDICTEFVSGAFPSL